MANNAKKKLRGIVQIIIINTSFPPLIFFYRVIYDLSIAIAVMMFRRIRGISAIYLRRGVAKDEAVYGLSDIDLSILIDDRDKQTAKLAKERIISIYEYLSRFIPLFGKADEELEVYTLSDFSRLYKNSNLLKYKINEDKYSWKLKYRFNESKQSWILLSGRDIVKDLPKLQDKELYIPAAEELKVWWRFLTAEFHPNFYLPDFKRKYIWYKAIAEAARTYLFICHGEELRDRKTALSKVKKHLSHEQNRHINKVKGYLKNLTKKENLAADDLIKLFIELSIRSFEGMEEKLYGNLNGKTAKLKIPNHSDLKVSKDILQSLKKLSAYTRNELKGYVDHTALIPQIEFSIDVLSNTDIDSFYFVLFQKDFIPREKLKKFNRAFKEFCLWEGVEAFVTDGKIALSLQAKEPSHCIKSPRECPLFFSLLSHDLLKPFKNSGARIDDYIKVNLPPDSFEEITRARAMEINEILSDKKVYKMKDLSFLRFFWGASRTKLLAHSLTSDEIYIPITSGQIFKMLIESFPKDADWLNDLHTEYRKELLGEESQAYRLFVQSVDFLRQISFSF